MMDLCISDTSMIGRKESNSYYYFSVIKQKMNLTKENNNNFTNFQEYYDLSDNVLKDNIEIYYSNYFLEQTRKINIFSVLIISDLLGIEPPSLMLENGSYQPIFKKGFILFFGKIFIIHNLTFNSFLD